MKNGQTKGKRVSSALLRASAVLLVLVLCAGGLLASWLHIFPALDGIGLAFLFLIRTRTQEEEQSALKRFPPTSVRQLKRQREILLSYAETNPGSVIIGFCLMYIAMQTFAVPGTLSLSILSGALYGVPKGLLLVSVISTAGATSCYMLSRAIGRELARAIWPEKTERFGQEVDRRRQDMLSYIIFLRVTPILPNTFINIASPVVRVPLMPFIAGTFIGCLPNNFIAVNAGQRLRTLQSFRDLSDARQLLFGVAVGCIAILPVYLRHHSGKGTAS